MNLVSKEIGGFFSLESYGEKQYHKNGILLNSARNALRYIIQVYSIKEIYAPYYTCPVIFTAIRKEKCKIIFYDIDKNFTPIGNIPEKPFILYNNYFGICSGNIRRLLKKHKKIIIDNAQSFFSPASGLACFYSPRKFFGLPDGGIAITNKKIKRTFEKSISYKRMSHLLMRPDIGAEAAYNEFKKNDSEIDELHIQEMSILTKLLMGNINYKTTKIKRCNNFQYLHANLKEMNELPIRINKKAVPMAYPLLIKKPGLKEYLIGNKIYIPKYWDGLEKVIPTDAFSNYLTNNLLPLPIDQRYGEKEMKRIVDVINAYN